MSANKIIALAHAEISLDADEALTVVSRLIVRSAFAKIEKQVEDLHQALKAEAEQRLVRANYVCEVAPKPGIEAELRELDLFDVRLRRI